jgi:lipoyl-dependent peroxiredoxin
VSKGDLIVQRKATAEWKGGLRDGSGTISTASGVLSSTPYSFKTRFEDGAGTNPEELIAAAHAGCFSMALSLILGEAGMRPESIRTTATVSLVPDPQGGFMISESHLDVTARIPGANKEAFEKAAAAAETGCPVSKLFKAKITMNAKLES